MTDTHLIRTIVRRAQAGADHRLTAEAAASLAVDALAVHLAGRAFFVIGVSVVRQQAPLPKTGDVVSCSPEQTSDPEHLRVNVSGPEGLAYVAELSWTRSSEAEAAAPAVVATALPAVTATRTMRMEHCDQAGHVNVQVFLELVDDAVGAVAAQAGVMLQVVEARVQFKSELFCGDAVVVRSGVRRVAVGMVDMVHGLFHMASGRLASIVETRCAVASGTADLSGLGSMVGSWASLPAARAAAEPRPPAALPSNAIESCRATIDAWDVDPNDQASLRGIIQLCSTGARQFLGAVGLDGLRLARDKITVAAVDYLVALPTRPRLGQNVVLRTVPLGFSAKSMRFCHYILDADTGVVFGTVEIVGVMLDLTTHQSCTIPPDVADTLKRLTAA